MSRLTFAIILIIATGVMVVWGVVPAWHRIIAARSETQKLIKVYDELTAISQKRAELTEQYNSISQSDLAKLSDILPSGLSSGLLLKDMEALANRHSLFLSSLDFIEQPPPTAPQTADTRPYSSSNVSFIVRGVYDSFRSFLTDLEKMIRIIDISNISFVAQSSAPGAQIFEYSLKGTIYSSR